MEYAIKYKRVLNSDETEILRLILTEQKSPLLTKLKSLKIVGRCGCGECLTVLFAYDKNDEFLMSEKLLFDYQGETKNGEMIGILVFGNDEIISELEFYSIEGNADILMYPQIDTIKKI